MGNLNSSKYGAGALDRRITILKYTDGVDEVGGPVSEFTQHAKVWAKVEYARTKEPIIASAETSVTQVLFVIRYRDDLDSKMKINYEKKTFNILGIMEIEGRRNYLEIRAEQVEILSGIAASQTELQNDENNSILDNEGESIIIDI